MKLTPLDIRHKQFKRGMRGYGDAEVDEFLDQVAEEFERVFKENIDLAERLETLQEQIGHYRTIEETLQKTLISAQQSAEEMKASAQKEAQLILRDAELRARDLVSDAERKARDTLNDAYTSKQTVEKETVVLRNTEADFRFKFRQMLEGFLAQVTEADSLHARAADFAKNAEMLKAAIDTELLPADGGEIEEIEEAAPAEPLVTPVGQAGVAGGRPWWEPPPVPSLEEPPPGSRAAQPFPPPPGPRREEGEDTEALTGPQPAVGLPDEEAAAEDAKNRDVAFLADVDETVGDNEFKW